jgi:hypothetical protein
MHFSLFFKKKNCLVQTERGGLWIRIKQTETNKKNGSSEKVRRKATQIQAEVQERGGGEERTEHGALIHENTNVSVAINITLKWRHHKIPKRLSIKWTHKWSRCRIHEGEARHKRETTQTLWTEILEHVQDAGADRDEDQVQQKANWEMITTGPMTARKTWLLICGIAWLLGGFCQHSPPSHLSTSHGSRTREPHPLLYLNLKIVCIQHASLCRRLRGCMAVGARRAQRENGCQFLTPLRSSPRCTTQNTHKSTWASTSISTSTGNGWHYSVTTVTPTLFRFF